MDASHGAGGAAVLDRADLRERVNKALAAFLSGQTPHLERISDELGVIADAVGEFLLDGGKRLRPAFCYWGWRGAGGADADEIVAAASCLELLHACALMHDDVMDDADTRRGEPAVHRRFAALHRADGGRGDPASFGVSAAILLGDLCLVWSDQLLRSSGLPAEALLRAEPVYDAMRVELMAGQYLDLREQALGSPSVQRSLTVARWKSAAYTIERPLHLGAALAGGTPELDAAYTRYGVPLGEAFQLRDDVLGVFGDPGRTGKPAGDDLREGKRTVLVALALESATAAQAQVVHRHFGDPLLGDAGVGELRTVIEQTGALDAVEGMIAARRDDALAAISQAPIDGAVRAVLADLAAAATSRHV